MKLLQKKKYPQQQGNNLRLIGFLVALSCSLPSNVLAEIETTILFQPPPESEQPESTESAASRQYGQCFQDLHNSQQKESFRDSFKLIPIVPNDNFALTINDRPNFWIYLPQTSARQIILSIKEEGVNPHWQQSVNLSGKTGIIGISLSDDAPELAIGKNYQWAVILVCGERPNPNDPVITSWIKRVDESQISKSQIGNSNLATSSRELEKAANYGKQGIWYDALDILVAERDSAIDNWQNIWVKYLQSGGLERIANEPIILEYLKFCVAK